MIAFDSAFHGRTLLAMSLTSKQHPYKAGMGPFAPEVYRAPFPNPYRWEGDDPAGEALAALRRMFVTHVAAEDVAAIIFEPVQGEGGFVVPPAEWVRGLRELADEYGIVLIADEVQSGYGRTGKMFAVEHFGVEPDLITIAKSMGAGVPISGVVGRAEVMDAAPDSSIGGTYVGSPLGCVAGVAVLDEIREPRPACPRRRDRRAHPRRASTSGRPGSTTSATCAVWGRCWRSSSSPTVRARRRRPTSPPPSTSTPSSPGCCCSRPAFMATVCECWSRWSRPTSSSTRRSTSSPAAVEQAVGAPRMAATAG